MMTTLLPVHECDDPLLDVRVAGGLLVGPPPESARAASDYCLLRREVYRKLRRVQRSLPNGYRLRLYEGLRSVFAQGLLFEQELARVQARHPAFERAEVHAEAARLVSPVVNWDGSLNTPPHSTGGAVDIEIVDADGGPIDFGMQISQWSSVSPELCALYCASLSGAAAHNRKLLAEAMKREGFVNYHQEWWHFSYGDQCWARGSGQSYALYGACPPEMIAAAGAIKA